MATIGQALTSPETGWKRYDDKNPCINKIVSIEGYNSSCFNSTLSRLGVVDNNVHFIIKSSKLRIIGCTYPSYSNESIEIFINGISNGYLSISNSTADYLYQTLVYENLTLSENENTTVLIKMVNKNASTFDFDAIDIDSNGKLIHPFLVEKSKLSDMKIGDYISCKYIAASGAVGTFSELGSAAGTELPTTPTATPTGLFNFVKVDKGLLIADRNIQSGVSWDTLANGGYVYGSENKVRWKLSNPNVLPLGIGYAVAVSSNSKYLVVGFESSPRIHIYENIDNNFIKLPNPDILPSGAIYGNCISFSADDKYLAIAHATTPFVTIYSIENNVFTKLPNPTNLPAGYGLGCHFSNDGKYFVVAHDASPYFTVYKRESNNVFTKLPNPTNLPTGLGTACAFSPDGKYLAIGSADTTRLYIYSISNDVLTLMANPATMPTGTVYALSFSNDSKYLAVGHGTSRFLTIYSISGSLFTKLSDPASLPTSIVNGCQFDKYGNLIVSFTASPYIFFYSKNGDSFIKQTDPTALPTGSGYGLGISKDGCYVAIGHVTTPFITIYKQYPNTLLRSPSGGCAYADANGNYSATDASNGAWPTNNEWDKYIRLSNLNGKITAGSDAVWNWNKATGSWCIENHKNGIGWGVNERVARGYTNLIGNLGGGLSTSTGYAFRPVLEYTEENNQTI